MTFEELEVAVKQWGIDKGIMAKSDSKSQLLKTVSEIGELADGINKKDREETVDALGDVVVTLILLCEMEKLSLTECLESAYNVIAKRKGSMVNGVFVKEEA